MTGFTGRLLFLGHRCEGSVQQRERPFAVELALGTRRFGVRQLEAGGGVSARLDGLERLASAALQTLGTVARVGEEMFHRAQQKGAETAPLRVQCVQAGPGEEAGEEFLREVAGGVFVRRVASDESED